jgi:ubiquinone/menaquinone biosynthesis C-methylase UbiE
MAGDRKLSDEARSRDFNRIAKDVFAPIYPVLAQQIVDRCKITAGTCIDLGSGPGHLAMALARITSLEVYALDASAAMCDIAGENVRAAGQSGRVIPVMGDVVRMPFDDGFADLIVSRGSFFFWDDLASAFREIYRVLKPDGRTYIGGGFGNATLKAQIAARMREKDPDWEKGVAKRWEKCNADSFRRILGEAGIEDYEIIDDETGFWIMIKK